MDEEFDLEGKIVSLAFEKQKLLNLEKEFSKPINDIVVAKKTIKNIDEEIRQYALNEFLQWGDSKPHDAVSVTVMKRKSYDSEENVDAALSEAPEALRIDPDRALAHLPEVARAIVQIRELQSREDGYFDKQSVEVRNLIGAIMKMLTVDNRHMAQLLKDGADWIDVTETDTPTVIVKSALGEYLLRD